MRVGFHPSVPKRASDTPVHCKCLKAVPINSGGLQTQVYLGKAVGGGSAVMGDVPFWCFSCAELGLFGVGADFTASFKGNSG